MINLQITLSGPQGCGKSRVRQMIIEMLKSHKLPVVTSRNDEHSVWTGLSEQQKQTEQQNNDSNTNNSNR